jgi:arabinofuranosyltransferase
MSGLCAWPYTVDDAYIVAGYARRLATGLGYTRGSDVPSDGVTGPLWLVPGAAGAALGGDPVVAAKLAGLACVAVGAAVLLSRLAARSGGAVVAPLALVLLASQPTTATWGVAGLETGAALLGVVGAILAVTARPGPRWTAAAMAVAVLPWLRPELVVVAGVVVLCAHVRGRRHAWRVSVALCASLALLALFRGVMFGALLPLAFHAKLGTVADGAGYSTRALLVLTGVVGLWLCVMACVRGRSDDRWVAAVAMVHVCAVTFAGGDWMPGFRLYAPVVPCLVWLMAVGAWHALRMRAGGLLVGLTLTAALLTAGVDWATRIPDIHASAASREGVGAALADELRRRATRVALVDVGYLGYASGLELIDLGGITDAEVARMRGGHLDKHVTSEWLQRRAPDAIVLHASVAPEIDAQGRLLTLAGYPVERRVAESPWVRARFRAVRVFHYAPHYFYVLLLP